MRLIELCQRGLKESLADENLLLKEETAQEIVEDSKCEQKEQKNLEIHHEIYDNSDLTKLKFPCRKCHRFLHRIKTGGKSKWLI